MASHHIARVAKETTEDELRNELFRIKNYQSIESQTRSKLSTAQYGPDTFQLTTKLLRLNPEYYSVWNARRLCLISTSFSKSSHTALHLEKTQLQISGIIRSQYSAHPMPLPYNHRLPTADFKEAGLNIVATEESSEQHSYNIINMTENELEASEAIHSELSFIAPLLMQHPKCYWIWNYRTWILQQAIDKLGTSAARALWQEEMALIGKMLHKDRRNYHAWAYRRHVVAQLESPQLAGCSLAEYEFEYTTKMIHLDLSNFSAWHNRSQLVCCLLRERGSDHDSRKKLLDDELELVHDALNVGPNDQSLWYYHKFLLSIVTEQDSDLVVSLDKEQRISYITQEINIVKEFLEDYTEIKWIYQILLECTISFHLLEGRPIVGEEIIEVNQWVSKLRELDPMRKGRWNDLTFELGLA